MEAYAEGFELMAAKEEFDLDLTSIANTWRHGSVVRSWLLDLVVSALEEDPSLSDLQAYVEDSGGRTLDGAGIGGPGRTRPGNNPFPVAAVPVPPGGAFRRQAAGGLAQPVRRPSGQEVGRW